MQRLNDPYVRITITDPDGEILNSLRVYASDLIDDAGVRCTRADVWSAIVHEMKLLKEKV